MCVPVICVRDATEALLSGRVPNLKLYFDAVDCYHLILQRDGASCSNCYLFSYICMVGS